MICHRVDGLSTKLLSLGARDTDLVGAENDNPKSNLVAGPPSSWGDWKSYLVQPVPAEKQLNLIKQVQEMETRANQFLHNRGITGKKVQVLTDDIELTKELLDARLLELKNSHKYTYDILVDTLGTGYFECSALPESQMIDEMIRRWQTVKGNLKKDRVKELTPAALYAFIEGHVGIAVVEEVCKRIAKDEGVLFKMPERKTFPVGEKPGLPPVSVRRQEETALPVIPPAVPERLQAPTVVGQTVQGEPPVTKKAEVKTALPPGVKQEGLPPPVPPRKPTGQKKQPIAVAKVVEDPPIVAQPATRPPVTETVEVKPQIVPPQIVQELASPVPEEKSRQVKLKFPDAFLIREHEVFERKLNALRNPAVKDRLTPRMVEARFNALMSVLDYAQQREPLSPDQINELVERFHHWISAARLTDVTPEFVEKILADCDGINKAFPGTHAIPLQRTFRNKLLDRLREYPRVQKLGFSELKGQFRLLMGVIQEGYQSQTLQAPQVQQYVNEFYGWLNHVELQGMSAEFAENVKLGCEFIDGAFKGAGADKIRQLVDIKREDIIRAWENDKGQVVTHGKVLGAGNFGEARIIESGREPRAMKVALDGPGKNFQGEMINLEKERQIMAMMDHPHIVKELGKKPVESKVKLVKEHEEDDFVMVDEVSETVAGLQLELVDGSLELRGNIWRQMPLGQRFLTCHQLMRGVRHIHRKGYAHLDLHLGNILYSHRKGTKVSDFGLAQLMDDRPGRVNSIDNVVSMYAARSAPERAKTLICDGTKADSWSLGISMAELLTGENPMHQPNIVQEFRILSNGLRSTGHAGTLLRQTLENGIWTFLRDRQDLLGPATNMLWDMLQPDPHNRLSVEEAFAKYGPALEQASWNPPPNDTRVLP